MLWSKKSTENIKVDDYIDRDKLELLNAKLILIDHNEMIFIYKRECLVLDYGVYLTQYYFKTDQKNTLRKLTKKNLIHSYRNSECILELKAFLSFTDILKLNEYGHFCLFDIINSHAYEKAYNLLKFGLINNV